MHEALVRGQTEGSWPHLRLPTDEALGAARAIADDLRSRASTLVVVGQPGAVACLQMLVEAVGDRRAPVWITSPDAAWLESVDGPDVAWLFLEGPAWVDRVAEWAVRRDRVVAVAGAGDHDAPPGGWWISDSVAGDGRFGALGLASLVCAAWAGVDVEELIQGARGMSDVVARPALLENPAYTLALSRHFAEQDLGLATPVHLAGTGRLSGFVGWACRMWGAVGAHAAPVEGVVRHTGSPGVSGVVGDEELVHVLLVGPRDKFVIVWDPAARLDGPAANEGSSLGTVFQDLWARENLPSVRVRLPALDAGALGAAILLVTHAAVTASLYAHLDPLGLDGVTAWYTAVERARGIDEGVPTA